MGSGLLSLGSWFAGAGLLLALAPGCGPRNPLKGPGVQPTPSGGTTSGPAARPKPDPRGGGREIVIGEMCPEAAEGRPAVVPILAHRVEWEGEIDELSGVLERREARQFAVFGWDGRRVGLFSVAGAATSESPSHPSFAIGAYAGGSPCQQPDSTKGEGKVDPTCVEAQQGCGLAVALLEAAGGAGARPFEEDPDPVDFTVGAACAVDGKLLVDLDGDGKSEAFPVTGFLDPMRAPAEEVLKVDVGASKCEPHFASRGVVPPADPRDWRGLDILGVLDLDGDGRQEIVATYHYANRRTWAVYSPRSTTARLELVGEGLPWSKR